jgi:hypothetical protein
LSGIKGLSQNRFRAREDVLLGRRQPQQHGLLDNGCEEVVVRISLDLLKQYGDLVVSAQ